MRYKLLIGLFILLGVYLVLNMLTMNAWGQDMDPRYYCLFPNEYPFRELCKDQVEAEINAIMEDMLEMAKQYNEEYGNK